MKQEAKHVHSTPDCCSQKSSYSILKLVLWIGLAALLVAAAVQAHAQDASQPSPPSAQAQPDPSADLTVAQEPAETPQPRHGRVVRLGFVQGQVQINHAGHTQFDQAVANMPLVESSVLQTGTDGRAEVQFEDGSIARIVSNSQLQLDQLAGNAPGSLETSISLLSGEGYFELRPTDGDSFTINAGGLQVSPVLTGSFRINLTAEPQQLAVSDGAIRVTHAGDYKVQVNANETLSLDMQDPARYMLAAGTSADPNDQWNEDRDQFLNDAAARSTGVDAGSDAAGRDDLDAYGNFYDVAGVGEVWQPFGYDASWDPFDAGYWAWYPWGYTWISAYPWGWAPFHCGYWNYYDDFGWGWIGGGDCGFGYWSPISGWRNLPRGWRKPLPPTWHRHPPPRRIEPVGVTREHPFVPMPGKPVPRGYRPPPVTIGGHVATPLQPRPPVGRVGGAGTGVHTEQPLRSPDQRAGDSPQHSGASPTWHGGSGYTRPSPPPQPSAPHYSPPPAQHFSPPPSSSGGGGSHESSSGGHK